MDSMVDALAEHLLKAEGEQVVRDMAGHVGDQLFDVMKRNGMAMETAAGSAGVQVIAAVQILAQADDFLRRSLDGEADATATAALAKLFMSELPKHLRAALSDTDGR